MGLDLLPTVFVASPSTMNNGPDNNGNGEGGNSNNNNQGVGGLEILLGTF